MGNFLRKNKKGFSLLEALIALFILTVGLLGIVSLIVQNIQAKNVSENQMLAAFLAQEGLELTRNIRDENILKGDPAYARISPGPGEYSFAVDYVYFFDEVDNLNDPKAKLYLSEDKAYWHSDMESSQSRFSRVIITNRESDDGQIKVKVIVGWQESGRQKTYEAETILYNWQ